MRSAWPAGLGAAVLFALGGCGGGDDGGGGGGGGSADTSKPEGQVTAFVANVGDGDWKAACARLSKNGVAQLGTQLDAGHSDVDQFVDDFGVITDCPGLLGVRGEELADEIAGAKVGTVETGPQAGGTTVAVVKTDKGSIWVDGEDGKWFIQCALRCTDSLEDATAP